MNYILVWETVKDYRGNREQHLKTSKNRKTLEKFQQKLELEENCNSWIEEYDDIIDEE